MNRSERVFVRRMVAALVVPLLLLSAMPVLAADVGLAAEPANDDVPGDSLVARSATFTGTLSALDSDDVYYVDLVQGEVLAVSISGPSSWYFDLFLFGPSTTSIYAQDAEFLVSSDATGEGPPYDPYPYELQWLAETTGRHYLDVYAFDGSGTYTITWRIVPPDNNEDIPGRSLTSSPVTGWVGSLSDVSDVYAVTLSEGQVFRASVNTGAPGLWVELFLYRPTATSVNGDFPVAYGDFGARTVPDGFTFLVPPGGTGTYYLEVFAVSSSGDYTLTHSVDPGARQLRLYGADRFDTAQAITRSMAVTSDVAIVATARNFPDALSAAGLAGAYDAPLVLVDTNTVPFSAYDMLRLLEPDRIIIVGGTAAVSSSVETELRTLAPSVRRLSGSTRYSTALAVAREIRSVVGHADEVFLARGDQFPDALAAAPQAFARKMPVLITPPGSLESGVAAFINESDVSLVTILGSTQAISSGVQSAVDALNGGATDVVRLQGADRYATAANIAANGVRRGWVDFEWVGVATGTNFPDALAGGVCMGSYGGVLLLTLPTRLSSPTSDVLARYGPASHIAVLGGTQAVSNSVYSALGDHVLP